MTIIGREREQQALRKYLGSSRPEFLAVYGRRRVGKTFLIKEFFNDDFTFYATGLANAPRAEQLESFRLALTEYGREVKQLKSWLQAFAELKELVKASNRKGRKVIFIDEMPWFDTQKSGFLTGLEYFWNNFASARPDVLLIVCGSVSTWMINKLLRDRGGLYGRVTQRMRLEPFTLRECEAYLRSNGIALNRYQILEYYMVFGGIPYYLNMVDKGLSAAQNIDALCFSEGAALRSEFGEVFASLFRDSDRHRRIVETLANKTKGLTRDELINTSKLPDGGTLTQALVELEQSGFIRSYTPFGKKKKGSLYQLIDFFSIFHLRFIASSRPSGETDYWLKYSEGPAYNAWSGYAFESVCFAHIWQIKEKLSINGVIAPICSWTSDAGGSKDNTSASDNRKAQIDLIIDRNDGIVNLCEIKFANSDYAIDAAIDVELRNRRNAFVAATKTRKAVHMTLVTTYGVVRNAYWDTIQSEVTMNDLFR